MGQSRVEARIGVSGPIERVFERLTDHEAMADWPGVQACRLVAQGQPRNGLGAVRRITVAGLTLDEEVVLYQPPRRFDYRIIRGLPIEHHASVRLSEDGGGGVTIDWQIRMSSRVPLLARGMALVLRIGLWRALRHLAKQLA